ncbi:MULTISPECIES: GNAT family N-acetyltransferase [unclassified Flavobacterium]|jgi:ribosomal protein S18 acetylase RimI-like enzyme|uniref:GNAT family N-acetyltransferase n=1 Tax=unclassified Flavobacterium TaxID=196869 RepID=UPI0025BB8271|nr:MULTISPECIES: GNAT family N-acetyltransferase [unclassified Flavobacterium]
MITISEATVADFKTIREIDYTTWPVTYGEILSKAQLDYMLEKMYSDATLIDNVANKGHHFILANEDAVCLGFASYEHHYLDKNVTRLHKLYLLPESQGKGMGKLLLDSIVVLAKENHSETISLNVNRFNKAFAFYKKMGFEIVAEENIEIGNGYLMEDYKMEKKL